MRFHILLIDYVTLKYVGEVEKGRFSFEDFGGF